MAMHDDILIEVTSGKVPQKFSPADLMRQPEDQSGDAFNIGDSIYRKSSIGTNLNNLSSGPGNRIGAHVKKGSAPCYEKHEDGTFSLILKNLNAITEKETPDIDDDHDSITKPPKSPKPSEITKQEIFESFVDYLSNKPFSIYLGHTHGWYPNTAISGWTNRLNSYQWPMRGDDWPTTSVKIDGFIAEINKLFTNPSDEKALSIYDDIKKWGNPRGTVRKGDVVYAAIDCIRHAPNITAITAQPLDSTMTKVYAFTNPGDYIIYDTRVAAAIISIAEDIYRRAHIQSFRDYYPCLGHMDTAGASGTRPRGKRLRNWPNAYQNWGAQLEANELCRGIRDTLNRKKIDEKNNWSLREVEAVLFMEGY